MAKKLKTNVTRKVTKRPARKANAKTARRTVNKKRIRKPKSGRKATPVRSKLVAKVKGKSKTVAVGVRKSRKNPTSKSNASKPSGVHKRKNVKRAIKPRLSKQGKRLVNKRPKLVKKPANKAQRGKNRKGLPKRAGQSGKGIRKGTTKKKRLKKAYVETLTYKLKSNLDPIFGQAQITLPPGSFEKKLKAVKASNFKFLLPLFDLNKPLPLPAGPKPPQAVMTTLTSFDYDPTKYDTPKINENEDQILKELIGAKEKSELEQNEFFRNKLTEPDYVVTIPSIKSFVVEQMEKYATEWDYSDDEMTNYELKGNPDLLQTLRINFIY